jgi:hypothetical protein
MDTLLPTKENNLQAGAPLGNQNALKYKTSEERLALCKKYCEHKRKGRTDASFVSCDMDTFNSYREKYPIDFPSDMINEAVRAGLERWETIGDDGTTGEPRLLKSPDGKILQTVYRRFNANSYQFMMQNMFGWRIKTDVTSDGQKLDSPILYIPAEIKK